jgi:hypothetical protein
MKTLILTSVLLVSDLIFGQQKEFSFELDPSWKDDFNKFEVVLNNKKFNYLSPKDFSICLSTEGGGRYQKDPKNVKRFIDLKGASLDKFYSDVRNNNDQIITGFYVVEIDAKDTAKIHKILASVKSTQEVLDEISKLKGLPRSELKPLSIIETFNPKAKGGKGQYYSLKEFYYTIDQYDTGEYKVELSFPIGKDRRL